MKVRVSNERGTIEVEGERAEVASVLEAYNDTVLGRHLTEAHFESIRTADPLVQVKAEEQMKRAKAK